MSDEAATHFREVDQPKPEQAAGRSISFTITLHPNGQMEFNIPTNKVLAYGLLGAAQEKMCSMSVMQDLQQQAKLANGGGMNGLLKKMGRG